MNSPRLWLFALLLHAVIGRGADSATHRYLYFATPDGAQANTGSGNGILVFDIDNGFRFVKRIANKGQDLSAGIRGLTGCLATHSLYYSTTARRMGRLDLETEQVVWERQFTGGCDRSSVTLDGSKVFAPTGWWEGSDNGGFVVIDGATGAELRRLNVGTGAHNSILSLDGKRLYLGTTTTLTVLDPVSERMIQQIPDVGEYGVFPYTIDHRQRYAYVCLGKHVGFDVVDLKLGKGIHRVMAGTTPIGHRTHGVALTPDE
jgi:DNA-binding beta-propeller fold protein YncE